MLEPSVHYARTSDAVSIAYTAIGDARSPGVPLVCLRPPQLSHMALEFKLPFEARWHEFETLAERRLVVRFDSRGCGLSDRKVADISLEARARDIDAVAARLGIERFALQGQLHAGSWAIAYAVANPDRVSHVILTQSYTRATDYWQAPGRAALEPLVGLDWVTYTEASMSNAFSWAAGELPRALAAQMRASVTPEDFLAFIAYERDCDVTALLGELRCPVLVTHFDLDGVTAPDIARRIAAAVPNGRLYLPKSFRESLALYSDFLDEGADKARVRPPGEYGLRIFVVASGEAAPGTVERLVEIRGGAPVASMAGTVTSLFGSVLESLECAKSLAAETGAAVGIHAGEPGPEPLEHADPALVTAVLAAGLAQRGQVVVSNLVRELAAGKGFAFEVIDSGAPDDDLEQVRLFTLR